MNPSNNIEQPPQNTSSEYPPVEQNIEVSEIDVHEQGGEISSEQESQEQEQNDNLNLDWGIVFTFFK